MLFDMKKYDSHILDAADYLKLSESEKANIIHSRIIPATFGGKDFGKIEVSFKTPVYGMKK